VGVLLGVVGLTIAVDLLSKQVAVARLVEGRRYALLPGIALCRLHNDRGSVSGLSLLPAALMWAVIVTSVGVAAAMAPTGLPPATLLGLGLSVGGATGNLADRVFRGTVVDFLVAGRWRVLNLADVAILAGLVVVLANLL
jgi:signal peptidase II